MPVFGNLYQSGMESEREVFMTLFDKDGNVQLAQNCGFRVLSDVRFSKVYE